MNPKAKTPIIIRDVPKQTWLNFRAICLQRGISAKAMVIRLITEFVKRES